jgi:hypothetical protein
VESFPLAAPAGSLGVHRQGEVKFAHCALKRAPRVAEHTPSDIRLFLPAPITYRQNLDYFHVDVCLHPWYSFSAFGGKWRDKFGLSPYENGEASCLP